MTCISNADPLPARLLLRTVALALVAGIATACGGGSTPPGTPGTRTIVILPNAPGGSDVDGDGICSAIRLNQTLDTFWVGDGEVDGGLGDIVGNAPFFGFLYFPLSELPADATVVGARVYLTSVDVQGAPYVDLGRLKLVRIAAATPLDKDAIIAADALTHDPTTDITEPSPAGTVVSTGQLAAVQAAQAGGEDLFIRLEFELPTDNQTDFDIAEFVSVRDAAAQGPRLEIVIEEE